MSVRTIAHALASGVTQPAPGRTGEVFDPSRGVVQAHVPLGDAALLEAAVAAAKAAQPAWAATNPQRRARVMFEFKRLVEANMNQLAEMLSTAVAFESAPAPKAIIVPHAGYTFSGAMAARAYAQLRGHSYERVVVIGPSHYELFPGASVFCGSAYQTPLGNVPIDGDFVRNGVGDLAKNTDLSRFIL